MAIQEGAFTAGVSLTQGSVSSYASLVRLLLPTPTEAQAIVAAFQERLATLTDPAVFRSPQLYGVGGSVRAAAKLIGARAGQAKAPRTITREDIEQLLALYEADPATYAHLLTQVVPDRVHTATPGCLIIRTLMDYLGASELTVCKHAIREGYLVEYLVPQTTEA